MSYPRYAAPLLRRGNYFRREAMNFNPTIDPGAVGFWSYDFAGWLTRRPVMPRVWQRSKPVTRTVRRRFAGRFGDSNRRLAKLLHHPVPLDGYDGMPSERRRAQAGVAPDRSA